ncbi:MAG: type II toxin-antitoxin system RelE family toxin [Terrimicrobiaceae bacterium]
MTYTIDFYPHARRFLTRLRDASLYKRIHQAIDKLQEEPRPAGCKKLAGSENRYRIRVGDYRIIYEIEDGAVRVLVLAIGNRRDVYN